MALYQYAIATGHNVLASILTNVENIVTNAPTVLPSSAVPMLGPTKRETIGGRTSFNGLRRTTWNWAAMSKNDYHALILAIFGDFDTPDAAVTIMTRDQRFNMTKWNAYAQQPQQGSDFRFNFLGNVEDLKLNFIIIGSQYGSFDAGFDLGYGS